MLQKPLELTKTSWTESLEALKPQSLGKFILLALRTLMQVYTALPFAWFFPTALLAGVLFSNLSLIYAFYVVLVARAARPSVEYKRTHYWGHFMPTDWVIFVFVYLWQALPSIAVVADNRYLLDLYHLLAKLFLLEGHEWFAGPPHFEAIAPFLSPFTIIWVLFMLDTQKTFIQYVKSFFRALGMMIYNYPFFLVTYAALRLTLAGGFFLSRYIPAPVGWLVLLAVVLPLYIAFITNFYVKRLHDQLGLYYRA